MEALGVIIYTLQPGSIRARSHRRPMAHSHTLTLSYCLHQTTAPWPGRSPGAPHTALPTVQHVSPSQVGQFRARDDHDSHGLRNSTGRLPYSRLRRCAGGLRRPSPGGLRRRGEQGGTSRLVDLSGYPDSEPSSMGLVFPDDSNGILGAWLVLGELGSRRRAGRGQYLDLSRRVRGAPLLPMPEARHGVASS